MARPRPVNVADRIGCPLYRVRCEALVGSHLGETTKALSAVLNWLEQQDEAIVLVDEVDTLFASRTRQDGQAASQEMQRTMSLLWQRLDRWQQPHLFIFATNLEGRLDPALASRMERRIEFGPPTDDQVRAVVDYWRETFHAYAPDRWADELATSRPASFRELWQSICRAVRQIALES